MLEKESLDSLVSRYREWPREELREKIITECRPIVYSIAKKYSKHMDIEDLIAIGLSSIVCSIETFDRTKAKFSTYIHNKIRGDMLHAIRDYASIIRQPAWVSEQLTKIGNIERKLETKLGRQPTEKEIADACHLPLDKYLDLIQHRITKNTLSLSALSHFGASDKPYLEFEKADSLVVDITGSKATLTDDDEDKIILLKRIKKKFNEKKIGVGQVAYELGIPRTRVRAVIQLLREAEWLD